jgi:hypothetical protein
VSIVVVAVIVLVVGVHGEGGGRHCLCTVVVAVRPPRRQRWLPIDASAAVDGYSYFLAGDGYFLQEMVIFWQAKVCLMATHTQSPTDRQPLL